MRLGATGANTLSASRRTSQFADAVCCADAPMLAVQIKRVEVELFVVGDVAVEGLLDARLCGGQQEAEQQHGACCRNEIGFNFSGPTRVGVRPHARAPRRAFAVTKGGTACCVRLSNRGALFTISRKSLSQHCWHARRAAILLRTDALHAVVDMADNTTRTGGRNALRARAAAKVAERSNGESGPAAGGRPRRESAWFALAEKPRLS